MHDASFHKVLTVRPQRAQNVAPHREQGLVRSEAEPRQCLVQCLGRASRAAHQTAIINDDPISPPVYAEHSLVFAVRIRPTIRPYRPRASAKIRISTMPTYSFDCCADARTPASPTMPIAMPAAMPLRPHARPAARCAKPVKAEYFGVLPTGKATAPPPRATNFERPLLCARRGGQAGGRGASSEGLGKGAHPG